MFKFEVIMHDIIFLVCMFAVYSKWSEMTLVCDLTIQYSPLFCLISQALIAIKSWKLLFLSSFLCLSCAVLFVSLAPIPQINIPSFYFNIKYTFRKHVSNNNYVVDLKCCFFVWLYSNFLWWVTQYRIIGQYHIGLERFISLYLDICFLLLITIDSIVPNVKK